MSAHPTAKVKLVLLPGMDGTGHLFDAFVAALSDEFDITLVRYPVDKALGYGALESIAQGFLPAQGEYVLLGESFSGPIVVSLAASADARLKGVVLCASFVRCPVQMFSTILRTLVPVLPVSIVPKAILEFFLLGGASSKSISTSLRSTLGLVSAAALRARLRAVFDVDVTRSLARLTLPILYLQALHDRVVLRSASGLVGHYAPHTQYVQFESPHFLLQTQPYDAAQVVAEFVRKCQ